MAVQLTSLLLFLLVCLTSCGQKMAESNTQLPQENTYHLDTAVIAIVSFDTTQYQVFKEGKKADLTTEDLLKIENILKKCIIEYNAGQEIRFQEVKDKYPNAKTDRKDYFIDLARYKRQYVAIINAKGEKEVWINCFCCSRDSNRKSDWKTKLIFVDDGGNSYFNLIINLKREQFYEFMVNGDA